MIRAAAQCTDKNGELLFEVVQTAPVVTLAIQQVKTAIEQEFDWLTDSQASSWTDINISITRE